jgi:sugar phosphate isomerase/epimerase
MERAMADRGAAFEHIDFEQTEKPSRSAKTEYFQANWDSLLRAVLSTAVGVVLIVVLVPGAWSDRQHMLEATNRMERLAKSLETVKTITPETASEVSRLMQRRVSDCRRTACEAALEARNHAARSRLKMLVDRHVPAEVIKAGRGGPPDVPAFTEQ